MTDTTTDPVVTINAQVTAFVNDARAKAVGGLTVAEFGSLTLQLLKIAVVGLESVPTDGAAKKAWALGAVAWLFDNVAGYAVPVYLKPLWLVSRPAIRALALALAGGALEQVLHLTRAAAPGATA